MKNRNNSSGSLILALFVVLTTLASCNHGDESLGKDLLPGTSIISSRTYSEKGTIKAFTFTDDKIRVDHPGLNFIGSFNDPLFGRTDASFAAQLRLPVYPNYDKTATADSVVLRLTYKRIYGDTATVQTLKVYELLGGLNYDAKYLSSFNIKTLASSVPLGSASFIPKFRTDSSKVDTTTQYVRVPIDKLLGNRLLTMDSLKMVSNDVFLSFFKGLYIESSVVNRKGTLIGISPTTTSMGIYYHTAKKDSLFFAYNVTGNSANVAGFVHDYRNAPFAARLNQETIQDSLVFIQSMSGTKVKVNVPSMSKWIDSTQYLINKATITFHVDTLATDLRRYNIPSRVFLKYMNASNEEVFPKDSELSSSYYGGFYNSTNATYSFNITRHLKQIMNKEVLGTSFYLVHSDRSGSPSRVVLKSGSSSLPIELSINYTRYK